MQYSSFLPTSSKNSWSIWNRCNWRILWREFVCAEDKVLVGSADRDTKWLTPCNLPCLTKFICCLLSSFLCPVCTTIWWNDALKDASALFGPRLWTNQRLLAWRTVQEDTSKWHNGWVCDLPSIKPCSKRKQQMQPLRCKDEERNELQKWLRSWQVF